MRGHARHAERADERAVEFQPGYGYQRAQKGNAMKLTCIGTDPSGLYLGILLKRRDPSHVVRFVDDPYAATHEPACFTCNPLKPKLRLADAEVQADVDQAL